MYEYFLEVLDFDYPKTQLIEYQNNIKEWKPNYHYSAAGINSFKDGWLDFYPDISDPLFDKILSKINLNFDAGCLKFVTLLPEGKLPFHIDPNRECVFMLPLTDNNAGIQWIDGQGQMLCEHTYKGPTVINAKILHGVPFNEKTRSFLQINLPCTWKYLIDNKETIF